MANPPPENLHYPFGRAIPNNFRWKGKFTTHDEAWWREYGEAMEDYKRDMERRGDRAANKIADHSGDL